MIRPSKKKIATESYANENAWLDLTSSWSIKDLRSDIGTLPEMCIDSSFILYCSIIINLEVEDPRSK